MHTNQRYSMKRLGWFYVSISKIHIFQKYILQEKGAIMEKFCLLHVKANRTLYRFKKIENLTLYPP